MDDFVRPVTSTPLTHAQTRLIIMGMMLPVFMGSLDQTVLASALPAIGRDFGDVHLLPWLITGYLIAITAATPLYGKISDIHGRRPTVMVALAIYLAGSLVCALAPNMMTLIFGRVLHGLGGAGLSSMGMIVLGDVAAPKDRAKYYIYLSITYTSAGALGPALGGFLSDALHWSAIFWLNIPMGLIALGLTSALLRRLPRYDRKHRLDFLGAALIVAASVAFMLMLNLGGVRFPWTSLPMMTLFGFAVAMGTLFVLRLLTATEPLIPIAMLKDPVARLAIAVNTFGWAPIVGLNIFLPVYLQTVLGMSATQAGLSLIVLMMTLNASAGILSPFMLRMRRYKTFPMIGLGLTIGSAILLGWNAATLTFWEFETLLFLLGLGFGGIPPITAVILQNTVSPYQFGIAIGTMQFSRNLLAAMIVAGFGALVLSSNAGGITQALPADAKGFSLIFYAAAASLTVALIALFMVEEKPLQTAKPESL